LNLQHLTQLVPITSRPLVSASEGNVAVAALRASHHAVTTGLFDSTLPFVFSVKVDPINAIYPLFFSSNVICGFDCRKQDLDEGNA